MSQQLINHSPDLQRLQEEGYDVEIRSNYLLIKRIPYVNSNKEIQYGTLVSELSLAGNITTTPSTHVAMFAGGYPCHKDGSEIDKIRHQSNREKLVDNLETHHSFSSKPEGGYKDYYEKMTTYVAIISSPAQSLNPNVTAQIFPVIESKDEETVFNYIDTASSRAKINVVTRKLELEKIAIVGLGGTGSYVLDLVVKTPVKEIHIFDGDKFLQHNAFRSPGAPSVEELRTASLKVDYFTNLYSKMRQGIVPHAFYIDESNVDQIGGVDFVFLCLDSGRSKKIIIETLEATNTPFVDVGMGIHLVEESETLIGVLRVTSSTPGQRMHVRNRISFSNDENNNVYSQNIQIADLNALNAALAVVKWKKLFNFYLDLDKEHHSTYTIDGNMLTNEDKP